MKLTKATVLLLVLVSAGVAHGLYFHIGETEQRCFIEEVPQETMIVGEGILINTFPPSYSTKIW